MAVTLEDKLVVAISSRALFDFEEENELFEQGDDRAYMQLQLDRLEQPAGPGVAFSLVRKLLAFNDAGAQRVEVVILSRNDPVSGMRVFRSAQHYGLPIQRGSFTRGAPPWRYLKPLNANLFFVAVACVAFSFGGTITVYPSLVSDFFGLNNLTKNYGVIYLGFGLGSIIGSIVASLFGGFMATFNLILVLLVVALVLSLTIRLPAPVAAVDRA